jgi:hypothetical protein
MAEAQAESLADDAELKTIEMKIEKKRSRKIKRTKQKRAPN